MKRRVLVTGAAGMVGGILRSQWVDRYALCLADVCPIDDLAVWEEYRRLDITDLADFTEACVGMDVVVHLAADASTGAEFYDSLLELNIKGAYNAFEAARRAGCRRVVYASSVNAIPGYAGQGLATSDGAVYPTNMYGASKCWGEAVARAYAHQHGLSCICVRLGGPRFDQAGDWDPDKPSWRISPRDTAELFGRCVDVEDVDFAIVPGVSRHRKAWIDVEDGKRIGFEPQDGTAFPRA